MEILVDFVESISSRGLTILLFFVVLPMLLFTIYYLSLCVPYKVGPKVKLKKLKGIEDLKKYNNPQKYKLFWLPFDLVFVFVPSFLVVWAPLHYCGTFRGAACENNLFIQSATLMLLSIVFVLVWLAFRILIIKYTQFSLLNKGLK